MIASGNGKMRFRYGVTPPTAANRNDMKRSVPDRKNNNQKISEVAAVVPERSSRHIRQSSSVEIWSRRCRLFAGRTDVHVDLHANRHFDNSWSLPGHFRSPLERNGRLPNLRNDRTTLKIVQRASARVGRDRMIASAVAMQHRRDFCFEHMAITHDWRERRRQSTPRLNFSRRCGNSTRCRLICA